MFFRIFLISALLFGPFASAALAQNAMGFLYSRSKIAITRNQPPPGLPWLKGPAPNPAVSLDVEVRDASGVYNPRLPGGQTGWFNLSAPGDHQGVMMVFRKPVVYPITRSTEFAPLDVLLVDNEGKIIQVIQDLRLSDLDHDIVPDKPILAFLFLQGGLTKKLSINPGDKVEHDIFKKSVVIINSDKTRVVTGDESAPAAVKLPAKIPALAMPDPAEIRKP